MPLCDRPELRTPNDPSAKAYRFMPFTAYVYLLARKSLHFTSIRKLQAEDPYEGKPTRGEKDPPLQYPDGSWERLSDFTNRNICASCWHMSKTESAAMWKLYAARDGVCIVSSLCSLRQALSGLKQDVHPSLVRYIDHTKVRLPAKGPFQAGVHKRECFCHERELRLVTLSATRMADLLHPPAGLDLQVDLAAMIERVLVNPAAPDWVVELTQCVTEDYGLSPDLVSKSTLLDDPAW